MEKTAYEDAINKILAQCTPRQIAGLYIVGVDERDELREENRRLKKLLGMSAEQMRMEGVQNERKH